MSAFYERAEIERTVRELHLGGSDVADRMQFLFEHAPVQELTDFNLTMLENFDNDVKSIADVKAKLIGYGRDVGVVDRVIGEMLDGMWFPPLILKAEGHLILVAGNTRLMVAKVTSLRPSVKIINWE